MSPQFHHSRFILSDFLYGIFRDKCFYRSFNFGPWRRVLVPTSDLLSRPPVGPGVDERLECRPPLLRRPPKRLVILIHLITSVSTNYEDHEKMVLSSSNFPR